MQYAIRKAYQPKLAADQTLVSIIIIIPARVLVNIYFSLASGLFRRIGNQVGIKGWEHVRKAGYEASERKGTYIWIYVCWISLNHMNQKG